MIQIPVRFPLARVDDAYIAVVLGSPAAAAAFGDCVSIALPKGVVEPLFVAGVDTVPADEIDGEVLRLLNVPLFGDFMRHLSRAYGTGLPTNVPITFYTLYDRPVEELGEPTDEYTEDDLPDDDDDEA